MAIAAAPEPKANMGPPAIRLEARQKVTGGARYAADVALTNPAYAYLFTSAIAKGVIIKLDLDEAAATPGVLDILSCRNAQDILVSMILRSAQAMKLIEKPEIRHAGQIVAVVVANTFEAAREAAFKIKATYDEYPPSATLDSRGVKIELASEGSDDHEDPQVGSAAKALKAAKVTVGEMYETPAQHHNAIELFATTCAWKDDELTIHEPSQFVYGLRRDVATNAGLDPKKIRVISKLVGGAFGGKGRPTTRTALIALAAERAKRPVKLVATRSQNFTIGRYRAETRHRVQLGATAAGALEALEHDGWELTGRHDSFFTGGTDTTARMYAAPNVRTKVSIVHADRAQAGYMRAPAETPYVYALETALDELAVKLGVDPVELRRINDTQRDPITHAPYTSRSLMQCYDEAALAFGWSRRKPDAGSMRDGDWQVGWGCATAVYPTRMTAAAARVTLTRQGDVRVETAAHELGTGALTVIAQTASERFGVGLAGVHVELGDTMLPPGGMAADSSTTASACSAVLKACDMIRDQLFEAATSGVGAPLHGRDVSSLRLADAHVVGPDGAKETLDVVFARLGTEAISHAAEWVPPGLDNGALAQLHMGDISYGGGPMKDRAMFAFGAEFVEVRVHSLTREIRVPRMIGAFAAGRIMNTRTARSQLMGGMIWGIGSALHEETEIDAARGRYLNDNLGDYLVPVNADVGAVDVILVPEEDDQVNPAGVKGLGELGIVGTAAAISNAVFHATGTRVRKLPIRIENLL